MYDISYNIHVCTQVCCALFCAVMNWVSREITRSFSSYSSCLLHWHWDHLAWFVASELILRDMDKFVTQTQQNTRKRKSSAYFLGCGYSIVQRLPILTRTPSHERPRPTHSDKSLSYVPYWSSHGCIGASIRRHLHVDVTTWKRFPYKWTFFPRIPQSPMDFPSKGWFCIRLSPFHTHLAYATLTHISLFSNSKPFIWYTTHWRLCIVSYHNE